MPYLKIAPNKEYLSGPLLSLLMIYFDHVSYIVLDFYLSNFNLKIVDSLCAMHAHNLRLSALDYNPNLKKFSYASLIIITFACKYK